MQSNHSDDAHERFTRLLLESEPVMLRSILVSVPNQADAREIMQETAVALWRQFDSYNPDLPFINWAMGFSRIHTRRFLSRRQRRAQLTTEAMEVLEQEMETSNKPIDTIDQHLAACLGKLTQKRRQLIQGYYHDNRTPEWLANHEGSTVEAIYKAIQRIRQDLQRCIEKQLKKETT